MIETIRERRSIRKYQDYGIEPEKIEILKEALLRSPSSKNITPWEFIFINDRETLKNLATCKFQSAKPLENAPLAVTICADESKNDTWIEDCSIAAAFLQLTAQSLGLGSCWIHVRNRQKDENQTSEDFVRKVLGIPEPFRVLCLISIGYPAEMKKPRAADALQQGKIHLNRF